MSGRIISVSYTHLDVYKRQEKAFDNVNYENMFIYIQDPLSNSNKQTDCRVKVQGERINVLRFVNDIAINLRMMDDVFS